jgi:RNA polymerase sigma-70 factor (ECF subfamily)
MTAPESFQDLMRRIRAGDEAAAEELVRRYEPAIRRTIRLRLVDDRLARLFDSLDICQSVLASFFVRTRLGQFDLDSPEHLVKLLRTMARNKLSKQVRAQYAAQRDARRLQAVEVSEAQAIDPGPSPSEEVALRELVEEARKRLTAEERQILEWRQQGRGWAEIAADLGGTPAAVRKRLERAVDLVARQLGLEQADDE